MRYRHTNVPTVMFAMLWVIFGMTHGNAANTTYQWKNVAIGGGGYVTGVFCHPKVKDLVYIRTDVGGFYRWDAARTQWIPLVDHFTTKQSNYYGGEGLALDPNNPNVVYIAAGKYAAQWAGLGSIFKSTDRGASWTKLNIDLPMGGNENMRWGGERLAVSPQNSNLVLFGSRTNGLMRSYDGGASWQRVTALPAKLNDGIGILSVLFDRQNAGTVYVNAYGDGIYQSNDAGTSWTKLPGSPAHAVRLALGEHGRLFATTEGAGASTLTPLPVLKNGSMSEGTDVPNAWGPNWGKIRLVRDTQTYKSAPASLRVWSEDAANAVTGGQTFDAPTTPFRATGSVKSTGNFDAAMIAIQVFDAKWKQLSWIVLADVQHATDWLNFSRDITLPAGAAKCLLVVNMKGQGTIWLDDVLVQGISTVTANSAAGLEGVLPGVQRYDGNGIWKPIAPRYGATAFTSISINPHHLNEVVIGAGGKSNTPMFLSENGGDTWKPVTFAVKNTVPWQNDHYFNSNSASMEFDPGVDGRVWFTDWYGVWRMDDVHAAPVAVRNYDLGLEEVVIFTLSAPPAGPELLTGVADVDGFVHDAGTATFPSTTFSNYGKNGTWFQDTYSIAYCAEKPQHIVRVCGNRWNSTYSGLISHDGGKTWQSIHMNTTETQLLRVAMSADNSENFLVTLSGQQAQVTHDGGATWTAVSGLPNGPKGPWYWGLPVAADSIDGKTFYYYADGKVYRSTDSGKTFTQVNGTLPAEWSAALKTAPGVHGEIWVSLDAKGLYLSRDGGTSFTQIANVDRALIFAVGKPITGTVPVVYLFGTVKTLGDGIFRSTDRGATWERISDEKIAIGDEPRVMEASRQQPGVVYIGTNGRGVYVGSPR